MAELSLKTQQMMRSWGLDPETKRRRRETTETYVNIANRYDTQLATGQFDGPGQMTKARLEYHIARVDALIERAVQGV